MIDITPDSKVAEVLDRWPQLEAALIEMSPHFQALRNPVLRRTVGKLATLRQASSVCGIPVDVLVGRLRAAAGLAPLPPGDVEAGAPDAGASAAAAASAWASEGAVTRSHDARAAIAADEQPLPRIMAELSALGPDDVYVLVTPFVPAPLVAVAQSKGFESHSVKGADAVRTYFRRAVG